MSDEVTDSKMEMMTFGEVGHLVFCGAFGVISKENLARREVTVAPLNPEKGGKSLKGVLLYVVIETDEKGDPIEMYPVRGSVRILNKGADEDAEHFEEHMRKPLNAGEVVGLCTRKEWERRQAMEEMISECAEAEAPKGVEATW